jgi:hypothetical protein
MDRFVHANTDGPANPYARVYDISDIERDFPDFRVVSNHKEFMHAPPLPVHGLPGGRLMGWHLWVEMEPRPRPAPVMAAAKGEPADVATNGHSPHMRTQKSARDTQSATLGGRDQSETHASP